MYSKCPDGDQLKAKANRMRLWPACKCGITFLFRDEMLDNNVGHAVPVGVAIFIEAMDSAEYQLVEGDCSILTSYGLNTRRE